MTKPPGKPKVRPLAPFEGAPPPAPDWFYKALDVKPRDTSVMVQGAQIRYRLWGDPSKPGLLLAHGNSAHARWWDFIAPYLMDDFHVAALNFSGMGDSAWRDEYTWEQYADEQIAVCEHAGFFDRSQKPIIAGHSMGGFVTIITGAEYGDRFRGIVLIDSPIFPQEVYDARERRPRNIRPTHVYPDLKTSLGRFRLVPEQHCDNLYIVDHVARHSIRQVDGGWTWKFDPKVWDYFPTRSPNDDLQNMKCRVGILRGEKSALFLPSVSAHMSKMLGGVPIASIPEAYHHVMLDQPLALTTALRTMLAEWAFSEPI
jgi:pimeloyl-ACP methyl ester carboxylesterase